jgi:hypothetical protein
MKPPRPDALRLVTRDEGAKPPKPPLGLRTWTPSANAVALLLDAQTADLRSVPSVAAQVPLASELAGGTLVVLLPTASQRRSLLRWFAAAVAIPRAVRCSALLARGYVDIGAGTDQATGADLAWGSAPSGPGRED